jgi:hypothetical protein
MQFLLLIYENEQRFASGYDPAELQEYRAFGQQYASAVKAATRLSQPTLRRPCGSAMASR